jgi:chemotaxis protein MotA
MRETLKAFVAQFDDEMFDGGTTPPKAHPTPVPRHAKT